MSSNDFGSPVAGWYPDPGNSEESVLRERFWDGSAWTEQTREIADSRVFSTGEKYASWWARAGATIIDGLIVVPINVVLVGGFALLLFAVLFGQDIFEIVDNNGQGIASNDSRFLIISFAVFVLLNVIYFAYQVISIGKWGKTIGDRVAGIRIASQQDGSKASWSEASKRTLVLCAFSFGTALPVVGVAMYVPYIINFFSMLWDKQSRCWHDILGGTVVLKEKTTLE